MPERVIRHRGVEPERWHFLGVAPDAVPEVLPKGPIAVPLAAWRERRAELGARTEPVGVWLKPEDDPRELASELPRLSFIAVHFPKFTDGRGYSIASLLRKRHGYRGELRAFGDIGRDQLFYLARVGFDSYRLAAHHDPHAALGAFDDLPVRYQGAVDEPLPLFRRRTLGFAP
jgi:uncharacterized protein (DUF934 family)